MRQTSLLAFKELRPVLGQRHEQILEALRTIEPATAFEVAVHLGYWDPNAVRPRINELLHRELIKEAGVRECQITHHKATEWVCV